MGRKPKKVVVGTKKNVQKTKSNGPHYLDNKEFLEQMIAFRKSVKQAKKENKSPPKVPEEVGEKILAIATRVSYLHYFVNYPFREEMISDGIENCLLYINNYDPKKSKNPFGYFTQIVFYAFFRRIAKEKKQLATKYRCIEDALLQDLPEQDFQRITKYGNENTDMNMRDFLEKYEESRIKKKRKRQNKAGNLEDITE